MSYNKVSDNILYLECEAGISGDMMVAALLDLGADENVLRQSIASIPAEGYEIEITRVKKAGIDCCDFNVKLDADHENHDHDMEYLHGEHGHEHSHTDDGHGHGEHGHCHEHGHDDDDHSHGEHNHEHSHDEHEHHHHHHEHRGLNEITDIINHTDMSENARNTALKIFDILAESESKSHAVPKEQVHFHEVGAIDSIVDIVAVAVCLDNLAVHEVIIPKLAEGRGTVRCQHGVLPVPVPAVANIVADNDLCLEFMNVKGEFVTPTGAAIAAAIKTSDKLPERFKLRKVGVGAGKRSYEHPSILRAMFIEPVNDNPQAGIYKLESNIDDCTGEVLGYTMERLFEAGARDVHYHPTFMKKSRPGWQLNVICDGKDIEKLETIIFRETTTIGIRRIPVERSILDRKIVTVDTIYGRADVKICRLPDGEERCYPEYESVARLARENQRLYQEVYCEVVKTCEKSLLY